ncbi:hypothetical protein [Streptomyces sp. Z423-1]|uniref:hypothetical protein n=1 Tax=unclassified Streptomyces TaxID=2593676 RepID=UPI001488B117|nr:hypothetical protein [Streptomyces sp. Z423-1]
MIKPESIPLFTGDLGQLEQHIDALRVDADGIRQAGGEAHRQFQGLSAFYQAPEAEQLFSTTAPARAAADSFADKVATVADALRTYAAEVAPIAKRLEQLQSEATAFVAGLRTSSGEFDENWTDDADKVQEHQALMHEVAVAQEAFTAAEIACHNRITALVGGTQYVMNTGAKQFKPLGAELYGYSAEVLDQAEELPWGTPVTQSHDWWDPEDFDYYFKSFVWDGLIVDNVWGTVDGMFSLAGINGSQEFKDSWSGLARVVVGAETYLMESGGKEPTGVFATDFAQGSKEYAKEFAKGFVAWDQWGENPARAAATVVFNGLTLGAGPLKAASAGRAGSAAKAAATVAKVGDAIDPFSAAAKVTGHAMPKIAEVTANLRGMDRIADARAPHSVLEFSDDAGRTVLVVEDGRFIVLKDGKAVTDAPMQERSVTAEATAGRERELAAVGAGSRTPDMAAHAGASHHADSPGAGSGGAEVSGTGTGQAPPPSSGGIGGSGGHDGQAPGGRNPLDVEREIMRKQVERANSDPQWFKDHYRSNGYRRSASAYSDYGRPVPQIVPDPYHPGNWIAKSDMPPALRERYVYKDPIHGTRSAVDAENLRHLDEQAAKRDEAIALDKAAERRLSAAEKAYAEHRTQELADAMHQADAEHSPLHGDANRQSELFGEEVAEKHAVPEHYPGAVRVDDGAFGNNRFDQVYRTPDGRYVVVEAKGSLRAQLGVRKGISGRLVTQGTREYFQTILQEMRHRAGRYQKNGLTKQADAELALANELRTALKEGRVDYVLVKANADGAQYAGYQMKHFDITK